MGKYRYMLNIQILATGCLVPKASCVQARKMVVLLGNNLVQLCDQFLLVELNIPPLCANTVGFCQGFIIRTPSLNVTSCSCVAMIQMSAWRESTLLCFLIKSSKFTRVVRC